MKFDSNVVQEVWEKARVVDHRDPTEWRKDQCGAWMRRDHYGSEDSQYGWKIEKTTPGGPDTVAALQAFQCANTYDIENGQPRCRVTADRADLSSTQRVDPPRNTEV